jgi:DNA-binding CsgD family transcriptional regulator
MTSAVTATFGRAVAAAADADALCDMVADYLQRMVGCGPAFVAAADPVTLHFAREARREIADDVASRFLAHELAVPDVVKFRALAAARDPVDTLFHATDRAPHTSARWRDVLEPLRWGDELRAAIRDGGRTWGFLCLHRAASDSPFDDNDVAAVREIAAHVAASFRRMPRGGGTAGSHAGLAPGVVVFSHELVVTSITEAAREWFDLLGSPGDGAPIPLMSVAAQTLNTDRPESVVVIAGDNSWVSIHASPLHGPGPDAVAVVVQPAHPGDAFPALAAAAQLTRRETDVAAAVLRGLSDRAIARSLRLSEYTVQDHLKRVYTKTGVRGRGDLVARVLSR